MNNANETTIWIYFCSEVYIIGFNQNYDGRYGHFIVKTEEDERWKSNQYSLILIDYSGVASNRKYIVQTKSTIKVSIKTYHGGR